MAWEITTADVVEWARGYDGPKFMAMLCDPNYVFSERKALDRSARIMLPENPTVGQVLDAYHSIQQWGDTGFMGRAWDDAAPYDPHTWAVLAEHLEPGAFGMAFASARGWHRMAVAIEDAGLRVHPSIFNWHVPAILGWAYGEGWTKAAKIRDGKIQAEDRPVEHEAGEPGYTSASTGYETGRWSGQIRGAVTEAERAFEGHRYGLQALKPALEPIVLFQKPYDGRPYDSITGTGAGALWIDGGRVPGTWRRDSPFITDMRGGNYIGGESRGLEAEPQQAHPLGRWPANLVLEHHPACILRGTRQVKNTSGSVNGDEPSARTAVVYGEYDRQAFTRHGDENSMETVEDWECHPACPVYRLGQQHAPTVSTGGCTPGYSLGGRGIYNGGDLRARFQYEDVGTVARYFQCPGWALEVAIQLAAAEPVAYVGKAKQPERHAGLEGFFWKKDRRAPTGYVQIDRETWESLPKKRRRRGNVHPTIKPIALTLWLARLLLPPAEYAPRRLLVPFSGSSSEMIGALLAGWEWIKGIEIDPHHARLGRTRIAWWEQWADALNIQDPAEILREYRAHKKTAQADSGTVAEAAAPPRTEIEQLGLWW